MKPRVLIAAIIFAAMIGPTAPNDLKDEMIADLAAAQAAAFAARPPDVEAVACYTALIVETERGSTTISNTLQGACKDYLLHEVVVVTSILQGLNEAAERKGMKWPVLPVLPAEGQ
jgi:hypothetical protein